MNHTVEYMGSFLGKFHPLMIHFPIVLVVLIAIAELLSGFLKKRSLPMDQALPLLWLLAVASSVVAVVSGFLLYSFDGYEGSLVESHKWAGFMLCGGIVLAGSFFFIKKRQNFQWIPRLYTPLVLILFGGTIYTSHLGGSLTHGADFLKWEAPVSDRITQEVAAAYEKGEVEMYDHFLRPLLKTHCMSCHNSLKTKGGLNMESWEYMMEGGKSGKAFLTRNEPDNSELFVRVNLPVEDDEYMPPDGKKPLPDEALVVMRWWIEKGADRHQSLADSVLPTEVKKALRMLIPDVQETRARTLTQQENRKETLKRLEAIVEKIHLTVEPDPMADSQLFALSLRFPPAHFDDQDLQQLLPHAELISKLSLPGSEITDEGLFYISQMENLRELFIPKTCIKGEGLAYLSPLPDLQVLNVSGTFLTNENCLRLMEFGSLKQVYLFQTEVSPNIVHALNGYREEVEFSLREGPYY